MKREAVQEERQRGSKAQKVNYYWKNKQSLQRDKKKLTKSFLIGVILMFYPEKKVLICTYFRGQTLGEFNWLQKAFFQNFKLL